MNEQLDALRAGSPVLGGLISPGFLSHLGANDRANVRKLLLSALGGESDVVWDGAFLDNFLADDMARLTAQSNVDDWTPQSPIIFFHGRDDATVPYANTELAFQAMLARGAGARIERIDCPATPSSHIACVPFFLLNDSARLAALAKGL
jgi:fermentation-respiration switch protein FrsA (DUF1100 family)